MRITRHFVRVAGRRVHYRRCGKGPALLLVHQSPRSSAEYEPLMRRWGEGFTCIAPDSPGFGQSDPLPGADATIDDVAAATLAFADALELDRVGAYGFHSGAIILMAALRLAPARFSAVAAGGYAVWTAEERALFARDYLPPFVPSAYGEHLTWLWNRVLEQSWFFPWFAVDPAHAMTAAHAEPARVDATVRDLLDAGDAYRVGYGAVLAAPRDLPALGAEVPPVLITAYDGDPLQPHLDRLGPLPATWRAHRVTTPAEHQQASRAFLARHPAPPPPSPLPATPAAEEEGFATVAAAGFDGLIHWRGPAGATATVAGPGRSAALVEGAAIDPPGHGLSDPWPGPPPEDLPAWHAVIEAAGAARGFAGLRHEPVPAGDPDRLFPDLSPDRFGAYLTRAWSIARAARLFAPWYAADAGHALAFDPAELAPARIADAARALLQAGPSARAWLVARRSTEGDR